MTHPEVRGGRLDLSLATTPSHGDAEMARSAELIERLLGDTQLRQRFRADPAAVLRENGLPRLATGLIGDQRALLTLDLRESRSSLAGVMVAAAAEGVDFTDLAERAAPSIEHGAGQAFDRMVDSSSGGGSDHVARPAAPTPAAAPPKPPSLGAEASIPGLASPPPAHHADHVPLTQRPAAATPGARGQQPPSAAGPAAPGAGQADSAVSQGAVGQGGDQSVIGQGSVGTSHAAEVGSHPGRHSAATAANGGHAQASHRDPGDLRAPPSPDLLSYPGDNATPEHIAAWMGAHAKQAGLPPELPVMASLVESTLRNLNYGDRDSVGFFQMRLGIWNNGPYAGYLQNPELQIKWFIDHAIEARAQDPGPAQSPSTWGEWVANVEQPAAQYRYRYQLQLATAQQLLNGADLTPAPVPHIPVGEAALKVALHAVGSAPPSGASAAGPASGGGDLVQYAYGRQGINLPGVPAEQYDVGIPVARHDLRPGDAVFFADHSGFVHHVGLYVGGQRFVSAPAGGGHVVLSTLSDSRFAQEYIGARRYTESAISNPKHYARTLAAIKR